MEDRVDTIRIEADETVAMPQVYSWLNRHRNDVVTVGPERKLKLGVPISGARAVIIAAVVDSGIGGMLRALSNLSGPPVRLVFDIRSKGGRPAEEIRAVGSEVLDSISRQIAEEDLVSRVA